MSTLTPRCTYHQWEVWLCEDQSIRGRIIEEWRIAQLQNLYEYHYEIKTRANVYYIVSHDAISREQAIWFATQLYEGKVRKVRIDLTGLGR